MKAIIPWFRIRSGFCGIGCRVLGALLAGIAVVPDSAATITRIIWTSHNGTYINDTIVNGTTSPLAFTATNDLAQPFLNATDSTIALNYGTYYVISFRGYGAHTGSGTISFLLDGVTEYSQNVIFPDPTLPSDVFAAFALPGGDRLTISATGFSADRIRIIADGAGLAGDGVPDAFYRLIHMPSMIWPDRCAQIQGHRRGRRDLKTHDIGALFNPWSPSCPSGAAGRFVCRPGIVRASGRRTGSFQ